MSKRILAVHLYIQWNAISFSDERNRTECVNELRKLLKSVHEDDLFQLASKVLTRKCGVNDTVCKDERNLFIDLVSGHGSHGAQLLILDLIVLQPNVTEEDLRRFLFHCIPLKTPHPVGTILMTGFFYFVAIFTFT